MTSPTPPTLTLRDEALLMLEGRGTILETARVVSEVLRADGMTGAIVGGVAVVLHGHVRTTRDVDVYLEGDLDGIVERFERVGLHYQPEKREFLHEGVPVHIVRLAQLGEPPREFVRIEGIQTVSFVDLIAMKLRSGTANLLRAQDLADVIGLIRHHGLSAAFASRLPKNLRADFRRLARAIAKGER